MILQFPTPPRLPLAGSRGGLFVPETGQPVEIAFSSEHWVVGDELVPDDFLTEVTIYPCQLEPFRRIDVSRPSRKGLVLLNQYREKALPHLVDRSARSLYQSLGVLPEALDSWRAIVDARRQRFDELSDILRSARQEPALLLAA